MAKKLSKKQTIAKIRRLDALIGGGIPENKQTKAKRKRLDRLFKKIKKTRK